MTDDFAQFCKSIEADTAKSELPENNEKSPSQGRPLSLVEVGRRVRVLKIEAGRDLNSRLAAMGLVPNAEAEVVSNAHPGPFVVSVKGSRIMLGRGMAQRIMVLQEPGVDG